MRRSASESNFRKTTVRRNCGRWKNLLVVVRLLAADGLELGEHGVDVEVLALLFGWLELHFLAGGLGGGQQRRAAMPDIDRLFLGRALDLEVELDLRAQAERHRVHRGERRGIPVG